MGNCVVPKNLRWGIPLRSSLLHCPSHLPPSALKDRKELIWRDCQGHLIHPLSLQMQKLSPERGSHSPGAQSCLRGNNLQRPSTQVSEKPARALSCLLLAFSAHPQGGRCHAKALLSGNRVGKCLRRRSQADTSQFPVLAEPRLVDSVLCTRGQRWLPACLPLGA